jgi:hypothetical protein
MTIDDLKELDDFQEFKKFIKIFILQNSDLWKLIYYPVSDPLSQEDSENPYDIFDNSTAMNEDGSNGIHGVLLFKDKNNAILNASIPIILINFHSTRKSNSIEFNNVYCVFRIICKGDSVQELANGVNRSFAIAKLIDDEFAKANVNGLGKVERISFSELSLNEENVGYNIVFKASSFACDSLNNKNLNKRIMGG